MTLYVKDNQKIFFGDAHDSTIHYDGTNLILSPDVKGSGILRIEQDGDTLDTPLLGGADTFMTLGLNQTVTGTLTLTTPLLGTPTSGVLTNCTGLPLTTGITGILASANLDADTAHLTTTQTFSGDKTFSGAVSATAGTMRIPLSATPTMAVDGDFSIDTTITDFSMGLIKYFDGEEMAVISVPIAQLTTPTDGNVIAYNATNDEFELVAAGAADNLGNHTATQALDLNTQILQFVDANTTITAVTNDLEIDVATGNTIRFRINDATELEIASDGDLQLQQNTIDFNTDGHSIIPGATTLIIDTGATTDSLQLRTGGANRLTINDTTADFEIPINLGTAGIITTLRATGDILKDNGTSLKRFARGTALQVLRVNSAGTDIEYATGGSISHLNWTHNGIGIEAGKTHQIQPWTSTLRDEQANPDLGHQMIMPFAGTLKNIYVRVATAAGASETHTFNVQKNGVTVIAVVLSNTTTGNDTSDTETFVAGDRISLEIVGSASATSSGDFVAGIEII